MRCYTVTDGELKSVSLANGLSVIFFSIASASLTFGLDLATDIALSQELTAAGRALDEMVEPASYIIAGIFFLAGLWTLWWRHNMIKTIKRESLQEDGV